jgi:hypothetical protein
MGARAGGNESRDRQHSAQHHPGGSSHGYLVLSMDAVVTTRTAVVSIIVDLIPEGKHENTTRPGV